MAGPPKWEKLEKCILCQSRDITTIDEKNNLCQCRDCWHIFNNLRPTQDEILNFYSRTGQYDTWIREKKARDTLWRRRLNLVKRERVSGALLDIGAGIGQFLYFAQNDFSVMGTEVSESAVEVAKERYNINLNLGELEGIDFGNTKFDVITLFHVLEHVPYPYQTIETCKTLLSEGAVLIIAVPNDGSSFSIPHFVARFLRLLRIGRFKNLTKLGFPRIELDKPGSEIHLSHFTPSVLENYLKKSGFRIIRNTLDRFYAVEGYNRIIHDFLYFLCLTIQKIFGINTYHSIWLSARKE